MSNEEAPGSVLPTCRASIEAIGRLIAIWENPKLISAELIVLDAGVGRAIFALGQADHAVNLTNAVLVLVDKGMHVEAVPLVRLTLECAVTGAWLAVSPGSGDAAANSAAKAREVLELAMEDLADPAGRIPRERARKAEQARATAKVRAAGKKLESSNVEGEAKNFEQRCAVISGGDSFYPYYRFLSEYSHAGSALLEHYGRATEPTPENPLGLEYDPDREFTHTPIMLGILATALIVAIRAWDDLDPSHAKRAQLDEVAKEMGAIVELVRKVKR